MNSDIYSIRLNMLLIDHMKWKFEGFGIVWVYGDLHMNYFFDRSHFEVKNISRYKYVK